MEGVERHDLAPGPAPALADGRVAAASEPVLEGGERGLAGGGVYFRLAETKGTLEDLDGWLRRKLRCILWRQWKLPSTRATKLMQRGLPERQARDSVTNGRGPWWNAGASHMNVAFGKTFFDELGLISLLAEHKRLNHAL